ncbi:glycosyltransferase family 2 protein [Sulfitobacter aestuarii]|uniref:Glycosyltransferase family 2 protein n=1 Tax=Sulfitobacter aestuarii TaxID=2161676 RepID=A0ABW5U017_9RHOB
MTTWGLCATILAPTHDILRFAAHHLEAGAQRLYLYLDAPNLEALAALKAHPKIRVMECDALHWQRLCGRRPRKHQVRQSLNATHAYHRRAEVDWLIHMDVDEFLVCQRLVGDCLADIPASQRLVRIRPMESLVGGAGSYKAFIPNGPRRRLLVEEIYPTYGRYLTGGFLSHLAGKVFLRSGLPDVRLQIHNGFQGDEMIPGPEQHDEIALAHHHADDWDHFAAAFRYRLAKGSYRAELGDPDRTGGLSLHQLLSHLEAEEGDCGLQHFFEEVCTDRPALRARLERHGLYRQADLALAASLARHFPDQASEFASV